MRVIVLGAALLPLLLLAPGLQAGPLDAVRPLAAGAGLGTFLHDDATGSVACPMVLVSFNAEPLGPTLMLRANGLPDPQAGDPSTLPDRGLPCALGMQTAFSDFARTPDGGYVASRRTDLGERAGVTTEQLVITPLSRAPVRLDYWASTVGGPAPTHWEVHAVLAQAAGA